MDWIKHSLTLNNSGSFQYHLRDTIFETLLSRMPIAFAKAESNKVNLLKEVTCPGYNVEKISGNDLGDIILLRRNLCDKSSPRFPTPLTREHVDNSVPSVAWTWLFGSWPILDCHY